MENMTTKDLLVIHNNLAKNLGEKELTSWKKAKSILIEQIEALSAKWGQVQLEREQEAKGAIATHNAQVDLQREAKTKAPKTLAETVIQAKEAAKAKPAPKAPQAEKTSAAPKAPKPTSKVDAKRTIREACLDLLCRVEYYENRDEKASEENRVEKTHPRACSVGLPYDVIVDMVREEFEGAQTSVACLRWYAVKVRTEDMGYENYTLPQRRPRATSKGKK